ncbi:hypothetical protein FQA39_LY04381 [Lamprigera yunnana]|nr:hypothetical protein FQA39_LY04381 [Lamprigera yunnana]
MELKEARKKKHSKVKAVSFLTLFDNKRFSGYFNYISVVISNESEMQELHTNGCFGKANFSRSYPTSLLNENRGEIVRKRVYDRRKEWGSKNSTKDVKKLIVVPDSESDDDYFTDLKPQYNIDRSKIKEVLNLSLDEAFFLNNFVKCLDILYEGKVMEKNDVWALFKQTDRYFTQNYLVYHYFRSKNWVVKPGIKFGGDFLLYKDGPLFYHASYLIIIDVLDRTTMERKNDLVRRSMEAIKIVALNRLCETVGKELLICQILWPAEILEPEPNNFDKFSINEVLMRRWISSENRE